MRQVSRPSVGILIRIQGPKFEYRMKCETRAENRQSTGMDPDKDPVWAVRSTPPAWIFHIEFVVVEQMGEE